MNKLILIDGNAIMHRAYHALPPLTTKKGEPINAVYGFVSMLLGIITELKPTHITVCFDRPEKTFRREKYIHYQAQRPEMDDFLATQITKMHDVLKAFKIPVYEKAGYEADDVIGTIAKKTKNSKSNIDETIIVTGDRDIFQLIDKKVKVYVPIKGIKEGRLYDEAEVKHDFDFEPIRMIDYKSLIGDSSDNYPGVPGIGPKTAINLLNKYKTTSGIYKHLKEISDATRNKLEQGKDMCDMSYDLATIRTNVPVEINIKKMGDWDLGNEEAIKLFMQYGFKTLLNRVKNFDSDDGEGKDLKLKSNLTKNEVEKVVLKVVKKLSSSKQKLQYAVRGTAAMVLQGLDMGVDDVDFVCDEKTSLLFNTLFENQKLQSVKYSESAKFKSYYGKFVVDKILVEVMGDWQIKSKTWGEVYDASDDEIVQIKIGKEKVNVAKLDLELKVSAQMGRWNEFHKIKKQLEEKQQGSLF